VIRLDERQNIIGSTSPPLYLVKIFVTRILTRDLFAVASVLFYLCYTSGMEENVWVNRIFVFDDHRKLPQRRLPVSAVATRCAMPARVGGPSGLPGTTAAVGPDTKEIALAREASRLLGGTLVAGVNNRVSLSLSLSLSRYKMPIQDRLRGRSSKQIFARRNRQLSPTETPVRH